MIAKAAICAGLILIFPIAAFSETLIGRIVGVADGDTITLLDAQRSQHKVRLMGIDAPEKNQPFGHESKKSLSDQVFGRTATVEWTKLDRYQRILGTVLVDGKDANLEQIRRGLAWHFKKYQNEQTPLDRARYSNAEIEAQKTSKGLWSDSSSIPPWDWRKLK
jgi:endonuclease YncB( thermonuclease family)